MTDPKVSKMGSLTDLGLLMSYLAMMDMVDFFMMSWIRRVIIRMREMQAQGVVQ